ncbi:MAG: ABC transporter ATP-binding protein [Clostridiales bacterium]|nr:ABC transporter ATP-binding protein [Clostridiales bacterium]
MLELRGLRKSFDGAPVLNGIELAVGAGEFVTLLGPSGCGKTTTLRIVAGLTAPDEGAVLLNGRDITGLPPEKRDVNTVFQSYALFPHMSVEKNISYGLRVRGERKGAWHARVREMLSLVALEGFERRMPSQLSGGQRQRVAIARSVVLNPKLLLLDEPLGALDLKLRQQMQRELKDIQKRLGIAFLYITHDQEEALNMSDRIAIMRDGRFEQVGAPEDIYERPATRFAAGFIGQSNFLDCAVEGTLADGAPVLNYFGRRFPGRKPGFPLKPGDRVSLCLRIERIRLLRQPTGECFLPGVLKSRHYAGGSIREIVELPGGQEVLAIQQSASEDRIAEGEQAFMVWNRGEAALVR